MPRVVSTNTIFSLFVLAITFISIPAYADTGKQLPLEAFYKGAAVYNVRLSPDGTHLLALKDIGEDTVIATYNLLTGDVFYPLKTDNEQFKFNWVSWANNDRILMSLRFDSTRGTSKKFTETRLLAADAKKPSKLITLVKPSQDANGWVSQFQDNVIDYLHDDPDHILLSVDRELPGHQTVYKANVYTGRLQRYKKERGTVRSWIADRQGVIRAGTGYNDRSRKITIKILDPKIEKWVDAWSYIVFDEPSIHILGFGHKSNELFLLADHQGRKAVFKSDLSKDGYPMELILSDPHYDIDGRLIYSAAHKEVVGIYYSGSSDKSVFWNSEFQAFQAGIDKALPDTTNYITNLSADARKYIVVTSNATHPGTILYGDRDQKTLTSIADIYPALPSDALIEKQFVTYKTRDGLTLEGYLSLPHGYNNEPIATILLPHGGPMSQDGKDFDFFSSFMVNRGYAVFQPNFRGSSGYGHDFMMQAVGGMGLAMQDDLEDGVKFLIDKKIANPKKMCIVGASYGGYAALMGATKTPDLFQCAISFAGISDIVKLRGEARYYMNKNIIKEQLGNDKAQLKKTSPVRMAEQIKIPVLLIHGDDDSIVPVSQSRIMAKALKKHNKNYEYIELEGGSHYLDYLPHRKQTFEAMENFLNKYLPIENAKI